MQCLWGSPDHCTSQHRPAPALHMLSFENFVNSMPPSVSELKVTPSFCFAFKIPDDVAASIRTIWKRNGNATFLNFSQIGWKNMVWNWGYNHRRQRFVKHNCSEWWFDLKIWSRTRKSFYSLCNQRFFVDFHRFSSSGFWLGSIQQKTVAYNKLFSSCFDTTMGSIQRKTR